MNTREDILSRIKPALSQAFGINEEEITPDARFGEDLGADSLDGVELLMAAENEFGINISDDDYQSTITVGDAVDMIQRCQQEAEVKEKKKREEAERKLKEMEPLRLAWQEMEEKNSEDYIRRTGLPYFTYDGTGSADDGSYDEYLEERDRAIADGTFHEWILAKAGWFVGKEARELNLDLASDVLSLVTALRLEERFQNRYDQYGRFSYGFRHVVTPDGDRKEGFLMRSVAQNMVFDILSEMVHPLCPETFSATRRDRNGICSCVGSLSVCNYCGTSNNTWAFDYTYRIGGCGRKHVHTIFVDAVAGTWKTNNEKYTFTPFGTQSTVAYGKINSLLRNLMLQTRRKAFLELISFRFGFSSKSITLPLVAKVSAVNNKCSKLLHKGESDFTTKDGRQYEAFDLLNPSIILTGWGLSLLIMKENMAISMRIDDEKCIFVPHDFVKNHYDDKTVFLRGTVFGDNPPKNDIIGISLCGKQSYRATEAFWDVRRKKGDVILDGGEKNRKCLNRLLEMMECVYAKS